MAKTFEWVCRGNACVRVPVKTKTKKSSKPKGRKPKRKRTKAKTVKTTKKHAKQTKRRKVYKKLNFKRPGPAISATWVPVGTVKRGNNGKLYVVKRLCNGVQRWVPKKNK